MKVVCKTCGKICDKTVSAVGRAERIGAPMFCDKACFGLSRRLKNLPTLDEKKAAKSAYDARRRTEKADEIKAKKREYHKRTYDPEKAAVERKKKMPYHIEYCRQPHYREYKKKYDRAYKAKERFGEFYESALILLDVESEINSRASRYEIYQANGLLNKSLTRKREL